MLLFRFCSMGVEYKYIGVFLYKVVFCILKENI